MTKQRGNDKRWKIISQKVDCAIWYKKYFKPLFILVSYISSHYVADKKSLYNISARQNNPSGGNFATYILWNAEVTSII